MLFYAMQVHNGYKNLKLTCPVLTMGIFDGVHRGHRSLLDTLTALSRKTGGESVLVTFHPHPRMIVDNPSSDLFFLTTMEEKVALIDKAGVDHLIIIDFNHEFSKIKACDFVDNVLVKELGVKFLVVGQNHHFGHMGEGNFDTITGCAGSMNFKVECVPGLETEEGMISSSLIRKALLAGNLSEANEWLGYDYCLRGKVVEGRRLGRELGFPTANIIPADKNKLIPGNGVYAVDVILGTERYKGMLSIGNNPTVNETPGPRSVEVNIFDFSDNIYGDGIKIVFRYRMRDEIKFADVEALKIQMRDDMEMAYRLLE